MATIDPRAEEPADARKRDLTSKKPYTDPNWGDRFTYGLDPLADPDNPIRWYKDLMQLHLNALQDKRYGSIVDIAAGSGNVAYELLRRGRRVVAIDLNAEALEILRKKCGSRWKRYEKSGQLTVVHGDALEVLKRYDDETFDAATHMISINFFPEDRVPEHLADIYRILRNRGRLAISGPIRDWDPGKMLTGMQEDLDHWAQDREERNEGTSGRAVFGPYAESYKDFGQHLVGCKTDASTGNYDPDEMREKLREAGFDSMITRKAGHDQDWFIRADKPMSIEQP